MTVADMLRAVEASLPAAVGVNFTVATDAWDLYEAYVFTQVVEAARADGYSVELRALRTGPPQQFVFRRGPGRIWSHRFSYAKLSYARREPLEAHVGVGVEGQSGVVHEVDVSVIDSAEAGLARREQFAPRARGLLFALECKYYRARLRLSLLREHLGFTTDLRSKKSHHLIVANVSHPELPRILKHHKRYWADGVIPGTDGERHLRQQIEPVLHRYRR